jgi:hypothetical protein
MGELKPTAKSASRRRPSYDRKNAGGGGPIETGTGQTWYGTVWNTSAPGCHTITAGNWLTFWIGTV